MIAKDFNRKHGFDRQGQRLRSVRPNTPSMVTIRGFLTVITYDARKESDF